MEGVPVGAYTMQGHSPPFMSWRRYTFSGLSGARHIKPPPA
jgi:hypothetical protein